MSRICISDPSTFPDLDDPEDIIQVYNCFDCCNTWALQEELKELLDPEDTEVSYNFSRTLLDVALQMSRRKIRVDMELLERLKKDLHDRIYALSGLEKVKNKNVVTNENALLQRFAIATWGKPLNPNSPKQIQDILYKFLRIPAQKTNDKGVWKVSTDKDSLEKVMQSYPRGAILCKIIQEIKDLEKDVSVLNSTLEGDRFPYSFNVVGTETGRWSSSTSIFDTGSNIQNVKHSLREIFVPDPGYTFFYADLKSAESLAVGFLSQDENYIKACAEGDVHVAVCKMVWPDLPWTNVPEEDRKIADMPYYRHHSYRNIAKRGGHGTNYYGKARTIALELRVQTSVITLFQALYYGGEIPQGDIYRAKMQDSVDMSNKQGNMVLIPGAFPGIRKWHEDTITELQTKESLTTPLLRKRKFWGRVYADATIRKAIAFRPQSLVGEVVHIGAHRIHKDLFKEGVELLANGHDALFGQVPEKEVETMRDEIISRMRVEVPFGERVMVIEPEIKFSTLNWKDCS